MTGHAAAAGDHARGRGDGARLRAGLVGAPLRVDLLVVGLGVTGAGVALDAATAGIITRSKAALYAPSPLPGGRET